MPQAHEIAREARKRMGLSQQEWADQAGVNRSQVRVLESGANVRQDTIERLLAPLGITILYTSKADLEETRRQLEHVEQYLDGIGAAVATVTKMLTAVGVTIALLTPDEIAKALSDVRQVIRYLGSIEVQAEQTERKPK